MHLAHITPSIFAGLGLTSTTDLLSLGQSPHGKEVLFLVDGLGADVIEKYKDLIPTLHSFTNHGVVATSFPSTTATSLATLMTGELPGTHAMLGYTVRVPRSGGRVLNSLKWDERVDPHVWQSVPTLFERAAEENITVSHIAAKRYENTGFTQAVFRGATYRGANVLPDMIAETKTALSSEPSFAYVYINDVDDASHRDGIGSPRFHAAMAKAAELITKLLENLPLGTRLWITADHGMINRDDFCVLGKDNDLLQNVELLGGEPRVRYLYVRNGALAETKSQWEEFFGEKVQVLTREESVNQGFFGPSVSEKNLERIGDLIVIANGEFILVEPDREEFQLAMVGHHGGVTEPEIAIPLLTKTL